MARKPKKDADKVSTKVHEASAANAEPQKNGPEVNAEEEAALPNRPNSQPMRDTVSLSAERHEPSVINAEIPEHSPEVTTEHDVAHKGTIIGQVSVDIFQNPINYQRLLVLVYQRCFVYSSTPLVKTSPFLCYQRHENKR